MHATCRRRDCALTPSDRFCMTCDRAAADIAPVAESGLGASDHASVMDGPPPSRGGDEPRPINAAPSDFATGATEQNVVYLGNRLMYTHDAEETGRWDASVVNKVVAMAS